MGEVRRSWQQKTAASVLLMRFDGAAVTKEQGEGAFESTMQRLGQLVAGNIRQKDFPFRYTASSIAIVLGETSEKEALMVVGKMRRRITAELGEEQLAACVHAGVAERGILLGVVSGENVCR